MDFDSIPTDWPEHVGEELRKSFRRHLQTGFFARFLSGPKVLDIGYKGYVGDATPIFPHAVGVDFDYPNYDGKHLPFEDQSQDAVFSSHTLEHITDYRSTLAEWFRVIRIGGFLVIAVPHQFLYERKRELPSRWNGDHKRFYTSASLLTEIEEALDPWDFRVRYLEENDKDFDYTIPPERHAGGCYEIIVVVERIERPAYANLVFGERAPMPEKVKFRQQPSPVPGTIEPVIAIAGNRAGFERILVLKLDHRGDFLIAGPAMTELRRHFPQSRITLACGPWNLSAARELEVFDEIVGFEFFSETGPRSVPSGTLEAEFGRLFLERKFDLAIDLRVDEDTRRLLSVVEANQRAGFGRPERFPFLDVFLPFINPTLAGRARRFIVPADRFVAEIGSHEGLAIRSTVEEVRPDAGSPFLYGPWLEAEPGTYEIEIVLQPLGPDFQLRYDVCMNGARDVRQAGVMEIVAGSPIRISATLDEPVRDLEVRLYPPLDGRILPFHFAGWSVTKAGKLQGPHQREMQALLVYLSALRARNPYTLQTVEGGAE